LFEKLKSAISRLSEAISQKTLSAKDIEEAFSEFEIELIESDVAFEVIEALRQGIISKLEGAKLNRSQDVSGFIKEVIKNEIKSIFEKSEKVNLLNTIHSKKDGPFVIVFLGVNGTGKTTTLAKIGYLLKSKGISNVFACADTYRAGAIEQLEEHARRLGIKMVSQRYGADPAAVGRDAVEYAKNRRIRVVLIDTAGRMQTSKNLMEEMMKIIRVVKPDMKIFVGDALAGNDAINQAREFNEYTNFDATILTKADADAKGGSALSIAYITSKPIIYLGTGQSYKDLVPFNSERFVKFLFGEVESLFD
jgi:fused signal recognition particle receptor